jgi:hypothetical protein
MDTLLTAISIILLFGLISVPILIFFGIKKWYRLKFDFVIYLILGLMPTAGIMWTFAWWSDYSNVILLKHYNGYVYNPDSGSFQVSYENVLPENIDRVKSLEINMMGIGWPLKAIMIFVFYSPYLLIVYVLGQLLRRKKAPNIT